MVLPVYHKGELELFANYQENGPTDRVRALLVHSQLEGEGWSEQADQGSGSQVANIRRQARRP